MSLESLCKYRNLGDYAGFVLKLQCTNMNFLRSEIAGDFLWLSCTLKTGGQLIEGSG